MENPIKMDDLGVPLFLETPIYLISPQVPLGPLESMIFRIPEVSTKITGWNLFVRRVF